MDRRLQDRRDVRREEHTTFAHSTEGNARHRGAEAVETRTSTELPEKKKKERNVSARRFKARRDLQGEESMASPWFPALTCILFILIPDLAMPLLRAQGPSGVFNYHHPSEISN